LQANGWIQKHDPFFEYSEFRASPTKSPIELHLNQLADESNRRFFNSVPTRLQLPAPTVDRLKHLAAVELRKNPEFQKLIDDLRRAVKAPSPKPLFIEADAAIASSQFRLSEGH